MPFGQLFQRDDAVGGAEKAGLLFQESAAAVAELGKFPAKAVGVEPADFRPTLAGVGFERIEICIGLGVAHDQISRGDVELLARLGLDPSPLRHGFDGESGIVRVEIRGPYLSRRTVRSRDRIRHGSAIQDQAVACAAPPRAPC